MLICLNEFLQIGHCYQFLGQPTLALHALTAGRRSGLVIGVALGWEQILGFSETGLPSSIQADRECESFRAFNQHQIANLIERRDVEPRRNWKGIDSWTFIGMNSMARQMSRYHPHTSKERGCKCVMIACRHLLTITTGHLTAIVEICYHYIRNRAC